MSKPKTYKKRSEDRSGCAIFVLLLLFSAAIIAWGLAAAFVCVFTLLFINAIADDISDRISSAIRQEIPEAEE